ALMGRNRAQSGSNEPQPPEAMTDEAQHEWSRIVALLRERNTLDALDQEALRDYLLCWQRLRECEAEITANGVLVSGGGGRGVVKNPACQLARQYRDALVAWSRELGLTLASRTRLAVPGPKTEKKNAFADLGEYVD